jgi:hypothetical protein
LCKFVAFEFILNYILAGSFTSENFIFMSPPLTFEFFVAFEETHNKGYTDTVAFQRTVLRFISLFCGNVCQHAEPRQSGKWCGSAIVGLEKGGLWKECVMVHFK